MLVRVIMGIDPEAELHSKFVPPRIYTKSTVADITRNQAACEPSAWFGTPTNEQKFVALGGAK